MGSRVSDANFLSSTERSTKRHQIATTVNPVPGSRKITARHHPTSILALPRTCRFAGGTASQQHRAQVPSPGHSGILLGFHNTRRSRQAGTQAPSDSELAEDTIAEAVLPGAEQMGRFLIRLSRSIRDQPPLKNPHGQRQLKL